MRMVRWTTGLQRKPRNRNREDGDLDWRYILSCIQHSCPRVLQTRHSWIVEFRSVRESKGDSGVLRGGEGFLKKDTCNEI